jgi:hypothetical protein
MGGCTTAGHPLLICHNANCVAGTRAESDDTLDALRGSLALRMPGGEVVFDGIELDSVWDRALGRCTFAHAPDPAAPEFADAASLVVEHVAGSAPGAAAHPSSGTRALYLKIELKTDVGGGAVHVPDEVLAHAACATAAAHAVIAAGAASLNAVVPIFDSDDPQLLAAIDPGGFASNPAPAVLFETGWAASLPPGFVAQIITLDWYGDPHAVAWDEALRRAARTHDGTPSGGGLMIWARSPPPQELAAILAHEPEFLDVNNVEEARAVIDAP